jgi:TPR repeat protein
MKWQYSEAMTWYERAAAQGHALARSNLAFLYDQGLGASQNRRKAFDLYTRAADLKSADAMLNIATHVRRRSAWKEGFVHRLRLGR